MPQKKYGVYEYLIKFRILCSGDCNIRVDLLVIYPVLIGISIIALLSIFVRAKKEKQ